MTTAVPIIDISGFAKGDKAMRVRIAQEVSSALEEIGFLVIQGHDVNPKTITAARELAWRFFDLPLPDKMQSRRPTKGSYRGYVTADDENLSYMQNEVSPPDLKEFFGFGQFGYGDDPYYRQSFAALAFTPNIWPEQPVGFRSAAMQFYREMEVLMEQLLSIFEKGLGLDQGYFSDKFNHHASASSTIPTKRMTPCRVSYVARLIKISPRSRSWRWMTLRVVYRSDRRPGIGSTYHAFRAGSS
jgi:isopenicillin N synthase-like dioxygenase